MVTRRSDRNNLIPRELCKLNRIQTDARAPSVDEKPCFVLEGGGTVEWLNQFESSGSVQGLECCVEPSGRAIRVRDEIGCAKSIMGLRYAGCSDLFEGVSSLGNLPDKVGICLRVFGESAASTRDICSPPQVLTKISFLSLWNWVTGLQGDAGNVLPTMDAPTTSPILISF